MSVKSKMYDSLSGDYDRFVNWEKRLGTEMPFIEEQLRSASCSKSPIKVLDAACGTGMHAIALADRGYKTAGADFSAGMIEKAIQNARLAAQEVEFRQAGFGELSIYYQDYDSVLCLGNSLPHITDPSMLITTLQDFGGCLRYGGLLIIQNRNFDAVTAKLARWMDPEYYCSDKGEWLFVRFYDFDPDGLITFHVITLTRVGEENWKQHIEQTRLCPILKQELAIALTRAGFKDIKFFGGLVNTPFDPETSGNLVVSARWLPD